ncbi:predicted protein [Phaeodactylum tricornutum CCAP 1055/1]|jgi:hypothetical protein|uniref:Uncharacterized protein n=3 Tax=Phaeodactylum tricornutum TaxID=2850 RepID=B7FT31_PHATC|nr:predicted protein [Phaeodactylum tricornutum CCAP 1055/1]EEC50903.1 predicted protein [Phaeodactylum tricornutum CCAP 1055/1]|eukprot:XP_002178089.1 predicted protein [Phaeodactylum tricornutum CCAP 1055/1]
MGKSIRSKIKRKHRAEFRATIGTEAHNEVMAKVQKNLQSCMQRQTLNSLDKLSSQLTTDITDIEAPAAAAAIDAAETTRAVPSLLLSKGENQAPVGKKSRRRKHGLQSAAEKGKTKTTRPKPRYFCEF